MFYQLFFLLALGLTALVLGGQFLVISAESLAYRLKIKSIFVGIFVLGFGSSAPEAFFSIFSALNDHANIAVANIVGSNIFNVLLVLGIFFMFHTEKLSFSKFKKDFLFSGLSFILFVLFIWDKILSRIEGTIFLILFTGFAVFSFLSRKDANISSKSKNINSMLKDTALFVAGAALLFFGTEWTLDSCVQLAAELNISEKFIGVSLVSFGTSLPELVICIVAILKRQNLLALGNILGSNIFNIFFILGTMASIKSFSLAPSFLSFDSIWLFYAALASLSGLIAIKKYRALIYSFMPISYFVYIYLSSQIN